MEINIQNINPPFSNQQYFIELPNLIENVLLLYNIAIDKRVSNN
jgi:hypothetical protein